MNISNIATVHPVGDRVRLTAGNHIRGPAIIEQMDATTLILPSMVPNVDSYLNLTLQDVWPRRIPGVGFLLQDLMNRI